MERDDHLSELREGKACDILERHNDKYWAKETQCVGVWWDMCPKRDLMDVVEWAQLPWLWEYKRKERKIPKKEREREKRRDFMTYQYTFYW